MMRTDLDHLPSNKRLELERVVRILFEEFEDATRLSTTKSVKLGRILKIVLFGSHARGDWVDDKASGYTSDYDLLVVVNHERLTDIADYWVKADAHLVREVTVTGRLSAPVNFIVHTLADVNDRLSKGRYFFTDLVRDGIALYEAPGHPFAKPEPLNAEAARVEAQGYFERWSSIATRSVKTYAMQRQAGDDTYWRNKAAFELHQATEQLYVCLLLVRTLYTPKSHRLNFLRSLAEGLDPRLAAAWPRGDKFSRRCFELLRRAYVEARYSAHYKITPEELDWLSARVEQLQALVEQACRERLEGPAVNAAE